MNFIKKSVGRQILVPFITLIVIAIVTSAFISYQISLNTMVDDSSEDTMNRIKDTNTAFNNFFQTYEESLKVLSKREEVISLDEAEIHRIFKLFVEATPEVTDLYLGTEQGEYYMYPEMELPDDYDPRSRPWYLDGIKSNSIAWTDVYQSVTGEYIISTASKVINEGRVIGVISMDISLSVLVTMIDSINIGDTGYATVIDRNGKIIAHPMQEQIGSDITQLTYYNEIEKENRVGMISHNIDGQDALIGFSKNEKTGWSILGIVFVDDFKQKAEAIIIPLIISSFLIILASIFVSTIISRRITKPLKEIANTMKKAAKQIAAGASTQSELKNKE
ncbi:cache domain-containing protein [Anaerobacillus sp. MEB173]|uniref:cache domain-containing protein n=1 Tax=Anaerobacillus sp. MEB173 TaxID=3383345 RepID=UPI003F938354